jgi:hypothetical protein
MSDPKILPDITSDEVDTDTDTGAGTTRDEEIKRDRPPHY